MSYTYFIGADVSKQTIDFTLLKDGLFLVHYQVENKKKAIQSWLKTIMKEHKAGGK